MQRRITVPPTKTEPADTKTRCVHGHSFDEANTYIVPKTGKRHCRTCATENQHLRSLDTYRPGLRPGACMCTGDLIRPLKNKRPWVCLSCGVGSLRERGKQPVYFSSEDVQAHYRDEITLKELLER